jgi:hypothetical protein
MCSADELMCMGIGASYEAVTDEGLVIKVKDQQQVLPVDTIVICAGQLELKYGLPCDVLFNSD